jgi:hypothetical protein
MTEEWGGRERAAGAQVRPNVWVAQVSAAWIPAPSGGGEEGNSGGCKLSGGKETKEERRGEMVWNRGRESQGEGRERPVVSAPRSSSLNLIKKRGTLRWGPDREPATCLFFPGQVLTSWGRAPRPGSPA